VAGEGVGGPGRLDLTIEVIPSLGPRKSFMAKALGIFIKT